MHISINSTDLTTALLKSRDLSPRHVRELTKRFPQSRGIIGELPDTSVSNVPSIQRPTVKRTILDGLAKIQRQLRDDQSIEFWDETHNAVTFASDSTLAQANELLRETFQHTTASELTPKGRGAFGAVYGLKVNNSGYVFKSFLPESKYQSEYGRFNTKGNGILNEAPMGLFWKENAPGSQFDTMCFADLNEGYMISKDVDTLPPPQKNVDMDLFGVVDTDPEATHSRNTKNGYRFDFGGQVVVSPLLTFNKTARAALTEVQKTPEEQRLSTLLEIYRRQTAIQTDINAGLYLALKLLPKEDSKKIPFRVKADLFASYAKSSLFK